MKHSECIFSTKSWRFDCIRNGNKRSSFGEKHGNFQLELPAEAHAALRGTTLPWAQGLGISWDGSLKVHTTGVGVDATDNHHCYLCTTGGLVCIPQTAAETLTQRRGQNTHKSQNTEARTVGRRIRWRSKCLAEAQEISSWVPVLSVHVAQLCHLSAPGSRKKCHN